MGILWLSRICVKHKEIVHCPQPSSRPGVPTTGYSLTVKSTRQAYGNHALSTAQILPWGPNDRLFFDSEVHASSKRKSCTVHSPDLALGLLSVQTVPLFCSWFCALANKNSSCSADPFKSFCQPTDLSVSLQIFLSAYKSFCQTSSSSFSQPFSQGNETNIQPSWKFHTIKNSS